MDVTKLSFEGKKNKDKIIYDDILEVLHNIGDQECQLALVELLHRIFSTKCLLEMASTNKNKYFSETMLKKLPEIRSAEFESDCRNFLLELNRSLLDLTRVISLPCQSVLVGDGETVQYSKPCDKSYTEFWVDFNCGSSRITIFCDDISSQSNDQDRMWQTISICKQDVSFYTLGRLEQSQKKGIPGCLLTLRLKQPISNYIDFGPIVHGFEMNVVFDATLTQEIEFALTEIFSNDLRRNRVSEPINSILIDDENSSIIPNVNFLKEKNKNQHKYGAESCATLNSRVSECMNPLKLNDYQIPNIAEDHKMVIEESPSVSISNISVDIKSGIYDNQTTQHTSSKNDKSVDDNNAQKDQDRISKEINPIKINNISIPKKAESLMVDLNKKQKKLF